VSAAGGDDRKRGTQSVGKYNSGVQARPRWLAVHHRDRDSRSEPPAAVHPWLLRALDGGAIRMCDLCDRFCSARSLATGSDHTHTRARRSWSRMATWSPRLRSLWPQGRGGSNPLFRTMQFSPLTAVSVPVDLTPNEACW